MTADHTPERRPTLPFTLRMPTNCADNIDGETLNVGTNHVDVPVILDPDMTPRGERRNGFAGSVIALREWDEQVFLHEFLHAVLGYTQPLVATTYPPQGHEVIARLEVALWETGWRFRDDALAALRAECDVLREQTARVEAAFAGIRCALLHWQPKGVTKAVSCANCQSWAANIAMPFYRANLHPPDPDHERTSG